MPVLAALNADEETSIESFHVKGHTVTARCPRYYLAGNICMSKHVQGSWQGEPLPMAVTVPCCRADTDHLAAQHVLTAPGVGQLTLQIGL